MTENQKKRITKLRQQGFGYAAIASELKMPVGTVKTFCRRNNLQAGDLASDTQPENISAFDTDDGLAVCNLYLMYIVLMSIDIIDNVL